MGAELLLDALLAVVLVTLAVSALRLQDRFSGVVVFMLFGLVMAIAWVRVGAVDLALAEAAIGAGITGALLLGALRRFPVEASVAQRSRRALRTAHLLSLGACVALGLLLSAGVLAVWPRIGGLGEEVRAALPRSGVDNPVTAVILNIRAYDTWLELAVLVIAALAIFVIGGGERRPHPSRATASSPVMLDALVRVLAPMVLLVALYLVWIGAKAPGGAFQAGALLGGMSIVWFLNGRPVPLGLDSVPMRVLLALGVVAFLVAGLFGLSVGALLEYPPGQAKWWILAIELASTASIALLVVVFFAGCAGRLPRDRARTSGDEP